MVHSDESSLQSLKRIVIVQPLIPQYRISLFERLAKFPGLEVVFLADIETPNQLNQYDPNIHGFRVMNLPNVSRGPFVFRPGLIKMLKALEPDAVILNCGTRDVSQARALWWCKKIGLPVGVWNMFYRIGHKRWITELYMRKIGRLADVILSYGERGVREQVARGTSRDKMHILYNSIDEKPIIRTRDQITEEQGNAFRKKMKLDGKKVILHLVRLSEIKRPDLMIQGFARLLERRKDVVLVFIGGGPLEDRSKEQVRKAKLEDHVRFMGPIYDEAVLGLWYRIADVFAMATCIGLSIHHAMAYGVPVVTDDNELTQTAEFEVLIDGVNGLTYRAGDMDDFASKICCILDDDELSLELSRNAIRRIEQDYNLDRMTHNFDQAIRQLLKETT